MANDDDSCFVPGKPVEPIFDGDYTFNTGNTKHFTALDYSIFVISLMIPILIGLKQAWHNRFSEGLDEFMLAGRNMPALTVGLSMLGSFLSAITTIGVPAEVYYNGTMYIWLAFSFLFVSAASAHIYMPVFYQLNLTSLYEYLELRFDRRMRTIGSIIFLTQMIVYMAVVLYAPSVAFNSVSGLNMWGVIVLVGLVCTFYVTLGGIKATMWADSFQVCLMFFGVLVMLVKSMWTIGTSNMWNSASRTGRIWLFDFRLDPRIRHTVWGLVIGGWFNYLALYVVNQGQMHRCITCRSLREVKIALWMSFPGHALYLFLCITIGLYMSAFYENCDPSYARLVTSGNEMIPLYMQDILQGWGLQGIYLAGVFAATLSSCSTFLNAMSMVVLEDYVKVYMKRQIPKNKERLCLQIVSVVFGCISLEITFLVAQFGAILQAAVTIFGLIGGPLLGVFSLGMFFPWANEKGAFGGLLVSMFISLMVKAMPFLPEKYSIPLCLRNCDVSIFKNMTQTPGQQKSDSETEDFVIYSMSYIYFSFLGCMCCISIGLIISYWTYSYKDIDPRLIVPVLDEVFPFFYLPEEIRKQYRYGLVHEGKFENSKMSHRSSSTSPVRDRSSGNLWSKKSFPRALFNPATKQTEIL